MDIVSFTLPYKILNCVDIFKPHLKKKLQNSLKNMYTDRERSSSNGFHVINNMLLPPNVLHTIKISGITAGILNR